MKRAVLALVAEVGIDPAGYAERDSGGIVREVAGWPGVDAAAFLARGEAAMVRCELAALAGARAADAAAEVLAWARGQGIGVAIVTRNSRVAVEQLLARVPLPFDVLLTRSDVPAPKPDPSHLRMALDCLGVAADEAVMIGDHPMDVVAGRAAGVRTIAMVHEGFEATPFDAVRPDYVLRSFDELRGLLALL
jgi:phosphoglycolate phosphatase